MNKKTIHLLSYLFFFAAFLLLLHFIARFTWVKSLLVSALSTILYCLLMVKVLKEKLNEEESKSP
jgi:hypothetical protein